MRSLTPLTACGLPSRRKRMRAVVGDPHRLLETPSQSVSNSADSFDVSTVSYGIASLFSGTVLAFAAAHKNATAARIAAHIVLIYAAFLSSSIESFENV
jgi:hypothetical protein